MRVKNEEGQAVVLVALAMSIFLIGAVGLAVDGSHLYSQRQMAQTAADSAAIAAMMSVFDGTYGSGATAFPLGGTGFSCTTYPSSTPCAYASKDGFALSSDTVSVSFPADAAAPGVSFSSDTTHLIQVTVQRHVNTTLMRLLGPTATTVKATAMAAIVSVVSPTPLLITDPSNPNSLTGNGNPTITICGGPTKSVEVNSSNTGAYTGGVLVDLSHAGPADPGDCSSASAGADFGVFGGDATNPGVNLGTAGTGHYVSPASPVQDPFAGVTPPLKPAAAPAPVSIPNGTDGCINTTCTEYSPGLYTGGISSTKNNTYLIFKPGIYYLDGGGLTMKNQTGGGVNSSAMCVGCAADTNTGTGVLFYDTGPADTKNPAFVDSGGFTFDTGNNISFVGPTLTTTNAVGVDGCTVLTGCIVPTTPYYDLAFWEDRTAIALNHKMGQGNGCFSVTGTIYVTNTLAIMQADSTHVQTVSYGGNPCSNTVTQGDIVVSDLSLSGTKAAIKMNLVPYGFLQVRQVALVQ